MRSSFLFSFVTGMIGLVSAVTSKAQSLQNIHAVFQDDKVVVSYDLAGESADQKFTLDLYGSHNNYIAPLTEVSGDVGKNISAGKGKRIEWDAAAALREYKGQITFRIKGEAVALPFAFKSPAEGSSVRRGKKTEVQWSGGRRDQTVQVELYRDGQRVQSITEMKNNGQYTWHLPGSLKTGKYFLKIKSGTQGVVSKEFTVKAKIPMVVKILPILAISGVAATLGGGGGGEDTPIVPNHDLPAAPSPD